MAQAVSDDILDHLKEWLRDKPPSDNYAQPMEQADATYLIELAVPEIERLRAQLLEAKGVVG